MVNPPAVSTTHAILDSHGLVKRRKRRRHKARGTPLTDPNALWCADFKGECLLGNRQYCYPLTITDYRSGYLLTCEGLSSVKTPGAQAAFERIFKAFGLPQAIRTDNGTPFAWPHVLFGLSRLSAWWLRLGIAIERIKPSHPQHNGRHERMHLTLKKDTPKPPRFNLQQQQVRFDEFIEVYNLQRPHQGPGGLYPGAVYTPSARPSYEPGPPNYPLHDRVIQLTPCGRSIWAHAKSTSVLSLPANWWGSERTLTAFGSSASLTMI